MYVGDLDDVVDGAGGFGDGGDEGVTEEGVRDGEGGLFGVEANAMSES
jgi:hypothetical protein